MSTLTHSPAWLRDELDWLGRSLSRGLTRFVESRQERADEFVRPYLATLTRAELEELGLSEERIADIKRTDAKSAA